MEEDIIIAAQLFLEPGKEFVLHLLDADNDVVSSHDAMSCGIVEGENIKAVLVKVGDESLPMYMAMSLGLEGIDKYVLTFIGISPEDAKIDYEYESSQELSDEWSGCLFKVELRDRGTK